MSNDQPLFTSLPSVWTSLISRDTPSPMMLWDFTLKLKQLPLKVFFCANAHNIFKSPKYNKTDRKMNSRL